MKRLLSVVLAVSLLCTSISTPSFGASAETPAIQSIMFGDGMLYSAEFQDLLAVVLTSENDALEISFSYHTNPAEVYQFFVDDASSTLSNDGTILWEKIYSACISNTSTATKMTFTITADPVDLSLYDVSDSSTYSPRSSTNEDLDEDLADIHGAEYGPKNKYSTTTFGPTITVKETMSFLYRNETPFRWSVQGVSALSVTSFVVGCLGLATTSTVLAAVAYIFGAISYADELISPSGSLNRYLCSVRIRRHTSINRSTYEYTYVDHIYQYYAYENPDLNAGGRAAVVPHCENEYYYYDGMNYDDDDSYFNDYSAQTADAYDEYLVIGQMD